MRGEIMAIRRLGEDGIVQAVQLTGNDTDRWNAVAGVVFLMAMAAMALVTLALHAFKL
jgi:hypothetical protein